MTLEDLTNEHRKRSESLDALMQRPAAPPQDQLDAARAAVDRAKLVLDEKQPRRPDRPHR